MNTKNVTRVVLTPVVRFSFCNLIKATEYVDPKTKKASGKWSYHSELLIPEDSVKKFRVLQDNALVEVDLAIVLRDLALEKWPELAAQGALQAAFSGVAAKGWPLKRGDAKADAQKALEKNGEHYRGNRVISVKSVVGDKTQPPSLNILQSDGRTMKALNRMIPSDMEQAKMAFVGGNYGVAELNIKADEFGGLKYLVPYINSATFVKEGPKFGGQGGQLMSRFEGVVGGTSEHNPMAGMNDEIPF